MTSAPKSDSTVAAAGAAMKLAQSRTLSPSKMPSPIVILLPLLLLVLSVYRNYREERSARMPFDPCWPCDATCLSPPAPLWGGSARSAGVGVAHGVREKFRLRKQPPPVTLFASLTMCHPKSELRSSRPHKGEG